MTDQIKKYELTDETVNHFGRTLHRIRALVDIPMHSVKAGELGGFIESEKNLSHEGYAWVSGKARVFDNAWVCGNARVSGEARVCGKARVSGEMKINKKVSE